MTLQQIKYVLAVVDQPNFELAAENCFVTQSTLSTMIGKLESEFGIQIFNRKTKPVSLTNEGEQLVERFRIMQYEAEGIENLVQELKGEQVGTFNIAVIPTVAPYLLPLFLEEFALKFPKVQFNVKELTSKAIIEALQHRTMDIGIMALPVHENDLIEEILYQEPFYLYDCTGLPREKGAVTIDDLNFEKLCLMEDGHCLSTQVQQICEMSQLNSSNNGNFNFKSGSMDSLLKITQSRKGITILPYLATLDLNENNQTRLYPFQHPAPVRGVGVIYHKHSVKRKLNQKIAQAIREAVVKILPEGSKHEQLIKPF